MEIFKVLRTKAELEDYLGKARSAKYTLADDRMSFGMVNVVSLVKQINLDKGSKIVDLGAFEDAALWALHEEGYRNLYGIDLNKDIYDTPFYTKIRYLYGNIENTHLPSGFFDFGLSLSVAERNEDLEKLFTEANRLLKAGSVFIVTANFRQDKKVVKRKGQGLFSLSEIVGAMDAAERCGFEPLFNKKMLNYMRFTDNENPIKSGGSEYALLLMGFRKNSRGAKGRLPKKICILNYSKKFGGIIEYTRLLAYRLQKEYQTDAKIIDSAAECDTNEVIMEFAPGVVDSSRFLQDFETLSRKKCRIYVDVHDTMYKKFTLEQRKKFETGATLMYRANELAEIDEINNYLLFPLISYADRTGQVKIRSASSGGEIILGTFGFASNWKRMGEIIRLVNKLGVKAKILLSISTESPINEQQEVIDRLLQENKENKNITIKVGDFTDRTKEGYFNQKRELIEELDECTHYIFALRNNIAPSASMQFVKMFNRPIISLDTFQAKQAQVIRTKFFASRASVFSDYSYTFFMRVASHIFKGSKIDWKEQAKEALSILDSRNKLLSYDFLKNCHEISRDEDGLEYLVSILGTSA